MGARLLWRIRSGRKIATIGGLRGVWPPRHRQKGTGRLRRRGNGWAITSVELRPEHHPLAIWCGLGSQSGTIVLIACDVKTYAKAPSPRQRGFSAAAYGVRANRTAWRFRGSSRNSFLRAIGS